MSSSRKFLKIVSLIALPLGISYLVFGVLIAGFGLLGGSAADAEASAALVSPETVGMLSVMAAVASAVVYLLAGVFGLRGANVPSKIGLAFALAAVCVALAIVNVVLWVLRGFGGGDVMATVNMLVGAVISALLFVFARNVKREREVWH